MEKFKKLLHSKKAKPVSDVEKSAKMDVLKDLKQHAMEMMGEKLGGVKKVTVAADSKEGIEKGLDKAKELIKKTPEDSEKISEETGEETCPECEGEGCPVCGGEESAEYESEESESEESAEHESDEDESMEDMSEEELDAKIKELMKKKEALKSKV